MVAGQKGKKDAVKNAVIHTSVHLGEAEKLGGFGIAVDIKVEGVEDEELIKAGHEVRYMLGMFCSGRSPDSELHRRRLRAAC
jgi:hypothetical protein